MPLFYGEGATAFLRLQETIMSRPSDLSLLAWEHEIKDNHNCSHEGWEGNFMTIWLGL